jgi:LPS-assembly protein
MSFGWILSAALLSASPDPTEVTLTAERVLHDGREQRTIAEGQAHLETAGVAVDADRIVYDRSREVVTAVGHVVARVAQGTPTSVLADVVSLRLSGERVEEIWVLDGVATARGGANVDRLLAATTKEALDAAGPVTMLMSGNHFVRQPDGGWRLENLELIPCECNFDTPSWSIRTREALLNPEADRVAVFLPVVWFKQIPLVKEVPLPLVPYLNLPLGNRATGLLFPKPGNTVLNGFSFEQPVFVTAGRSADFTFTPGYFFGGPRWADAINQRDVLVRPDAVFRTPWRGGFDDPVVQPYQQPFGIQGPRLLTEFRYVLSPRAQGRATVGLLYDLRPLRDPGNASLVFGRPRGLRGEASLFHLQDFGGGFGTRVDLSAHSDGYYNRDVTPDVIAREAGYLRSTAVLFHRGADHLLTLDTVLRQDLTGGVFGASGYSLFGGDTFARGSLSPRFGPNPIQRLPAVSLAVPLRTLVGPLAFDLTADAVQQRPLRGLSGDEGTLANEGRVFDGLSGLELPAECLVERFFLARAPTQLSQCPETVLAGAAPNALKVGLGDGVWQRGEREGRLRLNVMPRLWASTTLGGAVSVSATASWRQGLWHGLASQQTITRGYPLLSARIETELSRVFTDVRHAITPLVELRAVPFVLATSSLAGDASRLGGPAPYDEIDRSIGDNRPRVQAVAELRNRFVQKGGRELLLLDLGQGFDLLSPRTSGPGALVPQPPGMEGFNGPRLAESYARLGVSIGWFTVAGQGRVEPLWRKTADAAPTPRLTRLSASAACDLPGGHGFTAAYENVLDDGTNRARAPVDLLFGDPVVASAESRAQLLVAGARTRLGPFGLRYDVVLVNRRWFRKDADGNFALDARGDFIQDTLLSFAQQTVALSWAPACDCWRLDLAVTNRLTAAGALGPPEFGFNFTVSRFGSIGTQ